MDVQNRGLFKVWALGLSIATTILVLLLSILNKIKIFDLALRAIFSFGVIYLLTVGSLTLFERTANQKPEEDSQSDSNSDFGGNIDFTVGEDESLEQAQVPKPPEPDVKPAGQIARDLSSELPGSERQAEIVRRMGWD